MQSVEGTPHLGVARSIWESRLNISQFEACLPKEPISSGAGGAEATVGASSVPYTTPTYGSAQMC